MASTMPLVLNTSTAMPPLQKLTMRSSKKTWIRTVRVYGPRGACVRRVTTS